ncbi:MAG: mechanosensitive ion channel family protein [Methanothrix sp.]|nr:mechanosensitive ion channel family protein [Methanothrix sp.]
MKRSFSGVVLSQPKFITTLTIMRRLIVLAAILIGVMATTFTAFPESLGIITSIFVAAGFASIVVGLAAQSSLSNVISGIINSVSQPFRIGDAVTFRDEFCYIEDMRLIHTIMRTWDNRRLVVPNSILQNEVIINYSMNDPSVLVPVPVQVSYESDISKAMQIMTDAARSHPDCIPSRDLPNTVVMELQDSGILLRLLSMAKDQSTAFGMTRDLLLEIKKDFDEQGIEIPYPKRQLVFGREVSDKLSRLEEMWRSFSMN